MSLAIINQEVGDLMSPLIRMAIERWGDVHLFCGKSTIPARPGLTTHFGPEFRNESARSRLRSWNSFNRWVKTAARAVPTGTPLLLTSNPPFWPLIAKNWRKRVGGSVTLLLWDTYPEAIERFVGLKPTSPISRAWRRMNAKGLESASAVVTISADMKEMWLQYGNRPIEIVPTWVECDRLTPMDRGTNPVRIANQWHDRTVVMYSGNLGTVHDVSILPEAASLLRDRPDIQCVISGGGAHRAILEARAKELKLENLQFLPFLPIEDFAQFLASADIAVVSLAAGAEGISMPSKAYSNMAAGCALLTINQPGHDLDRIVTEFQCGINVPPGDSSAAAQAIRRLADEPETLTAMKIRSREAALTRFDASVVIPKLLDIVESAGNRT